ncbi:MAG: hypothetical protein K2Q13_04110 [Nitrosomonas sp.]|uniref:hypothetical protein n=1 Tax=Nitrosomonas sp. TaxID=42353 RepID=UPI0025D74756|nr:hypothetical protein [Nitrosomonas sp.]MBY0474232.1 hypothetical protein [Nitrosomonas sp.]
MAITELTAQRNSVGAGQSTTVTFNYPNTPTQGNLLVAGFCWRGDVTVTGAPSGWNLAASTGNGTNIDGAIYYKIAGSSEPTAAQFTLSGSQKASGVASEWSGIHATPLDKANGSSGVAGITLNTGATGTLSQANELVINLFSSRDTVNFTVFGQSQSTIGTAQSTGGTTASRNTTVLAAQVANAATSVDYTAQIDSAQTWVAAVATFKQAAVTHAASGSLAGQVAVVAGIATHRAKHTISGTLSGQGSQLSGVSERYRHHDASGNLVASGSNISGDVARYRSHESNADLIGQGSVVDGVAVRYRSYHADGDLVGQGALLSGDADRSDSVAIHSAAGDLFGQGSSISGRSRNGEIVASGIIVATYQTQSINATLPHHEISATYESYTIQATI